MRFRTKEGFPSGNGPTHYSTDLKDITWKNAGPAPFNFGAVAPPQPAWVRPAGALHLPIRHTLTRWWPWSCAFRDAYCRERALKVSHFIDALEPKPRPDAPS